VAHASKWQLFCLVQNPQAEGTGIVVLNDGKLTGGDTVLDYTGTYFQNGKRSSDSVRTQRHAPGQPCFRLRQFGFDTDRQIYADDGIMHRNRQTSAGPDLCGHTYPYGLIESPKETANRRPEPSKMKSQARRTEIKCRVCDATGFFYSTVRGLE
jgi:hypothetical protein